MDSPFTTSELCALGAGALTMALAKLNGRLALSKSKHRSLTGHARMARRLAALVPFYEYDERGFFRADDAPEEIALRSGPGRKTPATARSRRRAPAAGRSC